MGGPRAMLDLAARYADRRKAFGQTIRNFEGVSFRIAESLAKMDAVTAILMSEEEAMEEKVYE